MPSLPLAPKLLLPLPPLLLPAFTGAVATTGAVALHV
jgi:hypothetical protein